MQPEADVLVVGGGIIGLAVAHALARSGRSVQLLERGRVGHQTSWGNCGLVTPSHADPLTRPASLRTAIVSLRDPEAPLRIAPTTDLQRIAWLTRFALHCTERHRQHARAARHALLDSTRALMPEILGEEAAHAAFQPTGLTTLYEDPRNLEQHAAVHEATGVPFEIWSPETLRAREPLVADHVVGALHAPGDASVDPGALCEHLAERVRADGVRISEGVVVEALTADHRRITGARTSRGTHRAGLTVLAAGPWSAHLARDVGLALPIEPGKGYSITWPRPLPGMSSPLYFYEPKVVATPWPHGFRLGSTMEFVGYDASLDRRRLDRLLIGARRFLDHPLELGPGRDWSGWRPMTIDELPLIGPSARREGLWLAAGHGMMGISQSLATARLLRELLDGEPPHVDPAPYAPARFRV